MPSAKHFYVKWPSYHNFCGYCPHWELTHIHIQMKSSYLYRQWLFHWCHITTVDKNRLQFNDHISAMCCRTARQLNALARISKHIDTNSKHIIYNSFVASNYDYCPLVWHFCWQVDNKKLEKLQERSLCIIHNDYESSFETLLKCSKQESVLTKKIKNHDFRGFQNRQ